jgi:hypothetical protein
MIYINNFPSAEDVAIIKTKYKDVDTKWAPLVPPKPFQIPPSKQPLAVPPKPISPAGNPIAQAFEHDPGF